MKTTLNRLWYILFWIIGAAIGLPLCAVIFPVVVAIKIPEVFMQHWPKKIPPPNFGLTPPPKHIIVQN